MPAESESSEFPTFDELAARSAETQREAQKFWASPDHARRLLREARVPTVEVHRLAAGSVSVKRHGRRRRRKNVTPLNSVGQGWLLGNIKWNFNDGRDNGGSDYRDSPQQTVLLEHNVDAQSHWQDLGCVRVRPDEYGFIVEESRGRVAGGGQGDVEEQLGTAVGRLLGKHP